MTNGRPVAGTAGAVLGRQNQSTAGVTPEHMKSLTEEHALTPEYVAWAGFRSTPEGVAIPWRDGGAEVWEIRLDHRTPDSPKYRWPKGQTSILDRRLEQPDADTVLVVEGTLQHHAAAQWAPAGISVYGMHGCDGIHHGTDLSWAAGKRVFLALDADRETNARVAGAVDRVTQLLAAAGAASVLLVDNGGAGTDGLDDVLNDVRPEARTRALERMLGRARVLRGQAGVQRLRAELLDAAGLDSIPEPEWLVHGWLTLDTLARINGEPGSMKSFAALDLAAHIGTGRAWHGPEVRQGPVVYLVAEGARGVKKRVRAWEAHHKTKVTGVYFLPRPVQVMGEEWDALVALCAEIRPVLIVLDTQSRITVGVEENNAKDMGEVVQRMDALREASGACVLGIHHSPKGGEGGRGSSAVHGAVNTEWAVSKRREKGSGAWIVTVENTKEKDAADGGRKVFRATVVDVPIWHRERAFTELSTSVVLVLEPDATTDSAILPELDDVPAAKNETQLEYIMGRLDPDGRGLTKSEIKSAATTRQNGHDPVMAPSSFYRAWNDLEGVGAIVSPDGSGKRWRVAGDEDDEPLSL